MKKSLKSDKREWLNSLLDDAQHAVDVGNMKTLYSITKTICIEGTHKNTAIKDKGGKTITDDSSRLARWKEHFEEILNRPPPPNSIVVTANEVPEIEEINTRPISKGEVKNAISSLKNGKAAGVDNIVVELFKADIKTTIQKLHKGIQMIWENEDTTQKLHEVIQMIWENKVMPHERLKRLIVKLPKKGNLKECTNWRGITLLVIASLKSGADKRLRAEQARFRQGRSTTEQIFILCNIIEQLYEWQIPLVINFIDFEKAFDSLHRPSLWDIMYSIPVKIIRIVQLLNQESECAVLNAAKYPSGSKSRQVSNKVA